MLVSIIVPFYNVEPYFRRCLESIVNQSYQNLEILLINDCSPDNSIAIAKEYAGKDTRITIIEHEQNLGLGGARNSGLNVAQGEYIWFVDSDDEIATPFAVEHLVRTAQRDDSDIILFRFQKKQLDDVKRDSACDYKYEREHVFNHTRPFYPIYLENILHATNDYVSITPEAWIKFFKLSFLRRYHFQFLEHTLYEDLVLLIMLALAERVTQLPYTFYYYYVREGSLIQSKVPANHMEHFKRIASQMWGIYDQYGGDLPNKEWIIPTLLMIHLTYNTSRIEPSLSKEEYQRWLISVYDFLKEELEDRKYLLSVDAWPSAVGKQKEWQLVLRSFAKGQLSERQKIRLVRNLFEEHRWKEMVKKILPYGIMLWLLDKRGWRVVIQPQYSE